MYAVLERAYYMALHCLPACYRVLQINSVHKLLCASGNMYQSKLRSVVLFVSILSMRQFSSLGLTFIHLYIVHNEDDNPLDDSPLDCVHVLIDRSLTESLTDTHSDYAPPFPILPV